MASATHCPMASLPGPAMQHQTLWTLAPHPSLATFCFLLLVTLTPSGSHGVGGRCRQLGAKKGGNGTFLTSLVSLVPKGRNGV